MTAIIIAVAIVAAACVAELALLAYLLHHDRAAIRHPGDPSPDIPVTPRSGSWPPASKGGNELVIPAQEWCVVKNADARFKNCRDIVV